MTTDWHDGEYDDCRRLVRDYGDGSPVGSAGALRTFCGKTTCSVNSSVSESCLAAPPSEMISSRTIVMRWWFLMMFMPALSFGALVLFAFAISGGWL